MKHFIPLTEDFIVVSTFIANKLEQKDKQGYSLIDYVDETKIPRLAHGKNIVQHVEFYNSVTTSQESWAYQKVFIRKEDILKLAKYIQEIEEEKVIGSEDLPF